MKIRLATLLGTCCHLFYQIVYFALFWASDIFWQLAFWLPTRMTSWAFCFSRTAVIIALLFILILTSIGDKVRKMNISLYFAPVCDFYCLAGLHFFTDNREFSLRRRKLPPLWYDFFGPDLRKTSFLFLFDLCNYIFII